MSVLFLDFETKSACDLKKAGADVYARDPGTEVLCLGYAFDDEPVDVWTPFQPFLERIAGHVREGKTVVGHNVGGFEIPVWNYCFAPRYQLSPLKAEQCRDTMVMAYAMALPGALEDAAPAAGLDLQKDTHGHRVMLSLSQPKRDGSFADPFEEPEKFQKLYDYCRQDIEVERALYKRLCPLSESEQALWCLDHKINQRGVKINVEVAKKALELVELEKARFNEEIRRVTSEAVATYNAQGQFVSWIRSRGVEVEGIAKADVDDLLKKEDLPPIVREALELRREAAKSSTAKLEKMLTGVCEDGRARGLLQFHGATTGRWAGRRIQVQNFPRSKLPQAQIEDVFKILGEVS